jgi:hypothetical protein
MCTPPCCSGLADSARAGTGAAVAVPLVGLVGAGLIAQLGWPVVVLALVAAIAATAGALWLIASATRQLHPAVRRSAAASERPTGRKDEGTWRVRATATDLPRTPTRVTRPRALTAAEVDALAHRSEPLHRPALAPGAVLRENAEPQVRSVNPTRRLGHAQPARPSNRAGGSR